MRRLFWVGVGVGSTVAVLRKVRSLTDAHVPTGARTVIGAATGLNGTLHRVRDEFRTATAQREAELRADLLAGADPARSRATVDAWRAGRAADRHDPARAAAGSRRPEDPEDGPEGYSFY